MPEQKIKMPLPDGTMVDAVNVRVEETTERWCDFTLEDGTKVRGRVTLTEVQRAINDYDPQGMPWYRMMIQPVVTLVEIPDRLKKKET